MQRGEVVTIRICKDTKEWTPRKKEFSEMSRDEQRQWARDMARKHPTKEFPVLVDSEDKLHGAMKHWVVRWRPLGFPCRRVSWSNKMFVISFDRAFVRHK
jgi:hypothetical protein